MLLLQLSQYCFVWRSGFWLHETPLSSKTYEGSTKLASPAIANLRKTRDFRNRSQSDAHQDSVLLRITVISPAATCLQEARPPIQPDRSGIRFPHLQIKPARPQFFGLASAFREQQPSHASALKSLSDDNRLQFRLRRARYIYESDNHKSNYRTGNLSNHRLALEE